VRINNLDKHTLNLYTLPCIELGIATARRSAALLKLRRGSVRGSRFWAWNQRGIL